MENGESDVGLICISQADIFSCAAIIVLCKLCVVG